ncbi:MAG: transcription-repair coupling factor [Alphaproteobacteria bacterium]|nr:transcription-repair coupling factor [Alphaproteobacteria bacterium]
MKRYSPLLSDAPLNAVLSPAPAGSEAFILAEIARAGGTRPIIHIATDDREIDTLSHVLACIAPDISTLTFPAWDCLPYDRVSPHHSIVAERVITLATLTQKPQAQRIVLTTANAITQRIAPRKLMANAAMKMAKGAKLDRDYLLHFLATNGYTRLGKAMEPGEFAVRGDIIDIFPAGHSEGVRLDLFDAELETIRTYDPLSQTTTGELDDVTLHTVSEYVFTEENIQNFRNRYREMFGAITKADPLYESVSNGQHYAGMEHWLPLLHNNMETFFDYLPKQSIITHGHELTTAVSDREAVIHDYYEARKTGERAGSVTMGAAYHPLPPDALYLREEEWKTLMAGYITAELTPFKQEQKQDSTLIPLPFTKSRDFAKERANNPASVFDALKAYHKSKGEEKKPLILACYSTGSRERIRHLLAEHAIKPVLADDWQTASRTRFPKLALVMLPIEHGFELDNIALSTEQDLLGERIMRTTRKRKKAEAFIDEASSLTPGELVVHEEHGIGRFEGLYTVDVLGAEHDCLKLIYAGEDKLFIPVENIDVISRFGAGSEGDGMLDKLGGVAWQSRKARMKERIKMAAEELLNIAAARAINPAPVLTVPNGVYDEFAARFPYVETEDQERSITEVLEDLASGHPADRLVCGDVGFGKTEVAMRAAFVATHAQEGKVQVALVSPTTLLCRQHYSNFVERFQGLGLNIRQLSRLVPAREATKTRQMLKDGTCDIVIGTHALLSQQIDFANLGLMIVDEEQHFGVKQKERLKNLKHNVHVVTLSATPIPRTLQLALTGVRDLSLITTPPVDRLAVRTFVMPYDGLVLGEAIARERHRGGRIFYVVPRIKDLPDVQKAIHTIAPDAKLAVAHGQMPPAELDSIMHDFYEGKYDILLSTAIIESGIDIPTANTMIIHKADQFGLSQLYQLRGRVGRGKVRAYAYFTLPHGKTLTKQALQRLEVMQTLDTLGAGFSLASHDMDIRGFGNLVGEEQSGHVREVGVELYQHMFEEAVAAAKRKQQSDKLGGDKTAQPEAERWTPQINIGMSVLIPESYVQDLQLRLGLYRRMGFLTTNADIDNFAIELADRFGPLPVEVEHLLGVLKLKILCKQAEIERVDVGPKGAVLAFRNNLFSNPEKLIAFITQNAKHIKLRHDQKLVLMREWKPDAQSRLNELSHTLGEIATLAA